MLSNEYALCFVAKGLKSWNLMKQNMVLCTPKFAIADGKVITRQSDLDRPILSGFEVTFVVKGKVARIELSFSC